MIEGISPFLEPGRTRHEIHKVGRLESRHTGVPVGTLVRCMDLTNGGTVYELDFEGVADVFGPGEIMIAQIYRVIGKETAA